VGTKASAPEATTDRRLASPGCGCEPRVEDRPGVLVEAPVIVFATVLAGSVGTQLLGDASPLGNLKSGGSQLRSCRLRASDVPRHLDAAVEPVWVLTDPLVRAVTDEEPAARSQDP
jgi:hypothetical protein